MSKARGTTGILLSLVLALCLVFALSACGGTETAPEEATTTETTETEATNGEATAEPVARLTELGIEDVALGEGPEVVNGDTVVIEWSGYYTDGAMWNSSSMMGEPFTFTVGAGEVIEGWDIGILGMQAGGMRTLEVPADMAYGEEGAHPMISPDQDLVYEIKLVEIQ